MLPDFFFLNTLLPGETLPRFDQIFFATDSPEMGRIYMAHDSRVFVFDQDAKEENEGKGFIMPGWQASGAILEPKWHLGTCFLSFGYLQFEPVSDLLPFVNSGMGALAGH